MEPPYNNMNPSRVLMKIRKADPPMLDAPHKWYYLTFFNLPRPAATATATAATAATATA